jgi:hypothetical protein
MAGITLALKYEKKTSDLMKARRKTKLVTNDDWDWDGVDTIKVFTLTDPEIVDYNPTGANRYGSPSEVEDSVQTWQVTEDRAWTKTMDKKNKQDAMGIRQPGKYLAQVTKNKMVPEIDTYIIQTIVTAGEVANRDDIVSDAATTSVNAYSNLTEIRADIIDNEAPEEGLVSLMTADYYNFLKQGGFVLDTPGFERSRHDGDLGMVDNTKAVIVPSGRMPASTDLVITHPSATVSPEKLVDYTLHKNPPGISGDLLEYRHRYDAFVDTNRVNCIGIHKTA